MTEGAAEPTEERISPLQQLKDRREAIANAQTLRLQVPRWEDPEIYVEYGPAAHDSIRRGQLRLENYKGRNRPEEELNANADLLIRHCLRIVAVIDGQEYSLDPADPHGEPTKFDAELAANLGLPDGATARQACRKLFITDGDLAAHATALIRWSGYRGEQVDEEFQGESEATN